MTDNEFLARFEGALLADFPHADHVRAAFLYISRYSALEALQRFSTSLAGFAAARGKAAIYHETITWAFVLLIRERMARATQPQSWSEFSTANPDLLDWKNNILKRYYREETLSSPLARTTFLLPDKAIV
jgi:hypothetical protein